MPDGATVRRVMLEVIESNANHLGVTTILNETVGRLRAEYGQYPDQALLTLFYDLFRSGHLSWGLNLANPNPPWCHLTDAGRRALEHLSRDPANPDGYLAHLRKAVTLGPIAAAYLGEALHSYNSDCLRSAAVMVGCAAETLLIDLRNAIEVRLNALGRACPATLADWRAKRVLDGVRTVLDPQLTAMPNDLREAVDAYWPAFAHMLRTARNDAGHPSDLTAITEERVHAALLVFPDLASILDRTTAWVATSLK